MSETTTYDEARLSGQISSNNAMAGYVNAALLPNLGIGNQLKEIVSDQSYTIPSGLIWNADGSVSAVGTADTRNSETYFATNITPNLPLNKDFMVVLDFNRNGNTKGHNHTLLSIGGTSGQDRMLVKTDGRDNVSVDLNIDFTTLSVNGGITGIQTNLRKVYVFRWKSATGEMEFYYDGALRESLLHTITSDSLVGNDPFLQLGVGGAVGDALYMSALLAHPIGQFTQSEVDSMVNDPYQIFDTGGGVVRNSASLDVLSSASQRDSATFNFLADYLNRYSKTFTFIAEVSDIARNSAVFNIRSAGDQRDSKPFNVLTDADQRDSVVTNLLSSGDQRDSVTFNMLNSGDERQSATFSFLVDLLTGNRQSKSMIFRSQGDERQSATFNFLADYLNRYTKSFTFTNDLLSRLTKEFILRSSGDFRDSASINFSVSGMQRDSASINFRVDIESDIVPDKLSAIIEIDSTVDFTQEAAKITFKSTKKGLIV